MEIQVCTTRGVRETTRIRTSGSCCGENSNEDLENGSFGICVKIRPVRRSCSQPLPRTQRKVHDVIMEEPYLENAETEDFEKEEPDSALGNSQSLKSEDSGSVSISVTSQGDAEHPCDCSKFSSVSEHKGDLFDQLVLYFNKKNNHLDLEERGRPSRRPIRSGTFTTIRRTSSAQHTVARRRHTNSASRLLNSPRLNRNNLGVAIDRRQTSTPDSSSSNFDRSSSSDLGLSRIRTSSTSSSSCPNTEKQISQLVSNFKDNHYELGRIGQYHLSAIPPYLTLERKSSSAQRIEEIPKSSSISPLPTMLRSHMRRSMTPDITSQRPAISPLPTMLHSHMRRSMTPDITSQRPARRAEVTSPSLNGLLSPSTSRGSLDRMTADSLDRRRVRRRASDRFNDTIQGIGQLSSLPRRSGSALGNVSRDSDNWTTSSFHGSETSQSAKNSSTDYGYYKDKNGRLQQPENFQSPSDSLNFANPTPTDISINLVDSRSVESDSHSRQSSVVLDKAAFSPKLDQERNNIHNTHARPQTPLDVALNEDHDSIMRLARIREDKFTTKLISAMKELKDIAEVARIIDEVDDEEWLLAFVGELDHRLRYLMKLEEEESEGPADHEANLRERATILDVALDLISFLKDRSAYRVHRRTTFHADIEGMPVNGQEANAEDGAATIQRMRKLASTTPHNPYEMQKWQRQLSNLAGTLDKYIHVLQKAKGVPPKQLNSDTIQPDITTLGDPCEDKYTEKDSEEDKNPPEYVNSLSLFSVPNTKRNARQSMGRNRNTGVSARTVTKPKHVRVTGGVNANSNNNNSNKQRPSPAAKQHGHTLPVLDLRDSDKDHHILNHIGQAAHVQGGRDDVFSPNSIDEERFVDWGSRDCNASHDKSDLLDSRSSSGQTTSPGNTVVSAYCRFAESSRRTASLSNDRDARRNGGKQKSEFRMCVDDTERKREVTLGRRTRSIDTQRNFVPTQERNQSGGARPKVRPSTQSSSRKSTFTCSESSSNSDLDLRPSAYHRPITSSISTQCDLDLGLRQREKGAEEKLRQMKRRADLLKTGLEEVRQERDEKERKIAVLQAKMDRMKKNLVTGESEKGAVEEEMDRLNKLLKEKTVESAEEIEALKKKLEELERKLQKEREKYGRMNEKVESLQQQLLAAQRQCEQMAGGKKELEQQIHDLTVSLMRERKHAAQLQEENTQLEKDLDSANSRLKRNEQENDSAQQRLQQLSSDLEKKLAEQRHVLDGMSDEKAIAQEKASDLKNELEKAENRIGGLEKENQKLQEEKQDLLEALSHEQMMSKDLAKCYMEQVEYLNHELKVNEERKKAQKEQYDKEISRMLSEGAVQSGLDSAQLSDAREEAEREKDRAAQLRLENEKLKKELDAASDSQNETKSEGTSTTEDKSVQAEDMSYTRMRAFDWYSSQAHRDALRLTEQGRQLEMETRERLRAARDAMRQVNYSIIKGRSVAQSSHYGYQHRK